MTLVGAVLCVLLAAAVFPWSGSSGPVSVTSGPVVGAAGATAENPSVASGVASGRDVTVLTDSNFELETQAVTGSTSGDWFVKFYAPWCGHCRKMQPAWEELATKLRGIMNVAHLDATTNPQTAKRFGIRGFPTLVLLKEGQMYEHKGGRSVDELFAFATGGWKKTTGKPIPPVMTWFDSLREEMVAALQQLRDLFIHSPVPLLLLLLLGCLMGSVMTCLWVAVCSQGKARDKKLSKSSKKKD